MKFLTLLICALCVAVEAGTYCATDGSSATYTETFSGTGTKTKRIITTTGCPNHYSLCTGKKGNTGCGGVGVAGTATQALVQTTTFTMLAYPVMQSSKTTDTSCSAGAIGVAVNGVSIYGPAVSFSPCSALDLSDSSAEWTSFDMCSGHSQATGVYHYHFPPSCLLSALNSKVSTSSASAIQSGHSPQVGWAVDGFPIYGPKGVNGVQMQSCSISSTNSPHCTDSCGGLEYEIPTLDNFKYRYYMQGNTSDMSSLPSSPMPSSLYYPYATACRKGCAIAEYNLGTCTGTSGYTTSYTAALNAGYTTTIATSMIDEHKDSEKQTETTKHSRPAKIAVIAGGLVSVFVAVGVVVAVAIRRRQSVAAPLEEENDAVQNLL